MFTPFVPFSHIRSQLVKECKKINIQINISRINASIEISIHHTIWHDHGKIITGLCWFHAFFYEAFYYTTAEMLERGLQVDVSTKIEEPKMYVLAKSSSSDAEQGLYNDDCFIDLHCKKYFVKVTFLNCPFEVTV